MVERHASIGGDDRVCATAEVDAAALVTVVEREADGIAKPVVCRMVYGKANGGIATGVLG